VHEIAGNRVEIPFRIENGVRVLDSQYSQVHFLDQVRCIMLGLDPAVEERLQRVPMFREQPLDEGFFRFGHDASGYRLDGLTGWVPGCIDI